MTAPNPVDDVTPVFEGAAAPAARPAIDAAAEATAADDRALRRIANLPPDVGWMMVSIGVIGVLLPVMPGTPFLIAGAVVLAPGGPQFLTRWARRRPRGVVHAGLKQVTRWLDDLERRYPRHPSTSS